MAEQTYYRGQIYYIHSNAVVGCEQAGGRPAVIVSNDINNRHSDVVEVVFLTTKDKTPLPTHVRVMSTGIPSTALCEQIEAVDKRRIGNYVNEVPPAEMKNIEKAMMISLGMVSNLNAGKALEKWRRMMEEKEKEEREAAEAAEAAGMAADESTDKSADVSVEPKGKPVRPFQKGPNPAIQQAEEVEPGTESDEPGKYEALIHLMEAEREEAKISRVKLETERDVYKELYMAFLTETRR